MDINRNNYLSFFIAFREKNITSGEERRLLEFLDKNPDLQEEFAACSNLILEPDPTITFPGKSLLKKKEIASAGKINETNYEHYFIGFHENTLQAEEVSLLRVFLDKNPFLLPELTAFGHSFLQPEPEIVFPHREGLIKSKPAVKTITLLRLVAAAASIAILGGLYLILTQNQPLDSDAIPTIPIALESKTIKEISLPNPESEKNKPIAISKTSHSGQMNNAFQPERQTVVTRMEMLPGTLETVAENKPIEAIPLRIGINPATEDILIASSDGKQDRSVAGILIRGVANRIKSLFPEKILPEDKTLLETTVDGYNFLADRNLNVQKEIDPDGRLLSMSLEGRFFSFSRTFGDKKADQ